MASRRPSPPTQRQMCAAFAVRGARGVQPLGVTPPPVPVGRARRKLPAERVSTRSGRLPPTPRREPRRGAHATRRSRAVCARCARASTPSQTRALDADQGIRLRLRRRVAAQLREGRGAEQSRVGPARRARRRGRADAPGAREDAAPRHRGRAHARASCSWAWASRRTSRSSPATSPLLAAACARKASLEFARVGAAPADDLGDAAEAVDLDTARRLTGPGEHRPRARPEEAAPRFRRAHVAQGVGWTMTNWEKPVVRVGDRVAKQPADEGVVWHLSLARSARLERGGVAEKGDARGGRRRT